MDEPEDDGMALVMPFVVVKSEGGPYDDDAFTAGYECGLIDQALTVAVACNAETLFRTVRTANLPQLDLIAMRHGFTAKAETNEYGNAEWSDVTFTVVCDYDPPDRNPGL